jgi:hypothetical protein
VRAENLTYRKLQKDFAAGAWRSPKIVRKANTRGARVRQAGGEYQGQVAGPAEHGLSRLVALPLDSDRRIGACNASSGPTANSTSASWNAAFVTVRGIMRC